MSAKKFVTILLIVAAVVLGGFAIYLGYQISQEDQGEDVAADCPSGWCTGKIDCPRDQGWEWDPNSTYCGELGCCYQPAPGEDIDDGGSCVITYDGGVTGCLTLSSSCQNETINIYWRRAENDTTDGDCVGTSSNPGTREFSGPRSVCPRDQGPGGCGYCVQLDDNYGGGAAQFTGDCEDDPGPSCGDGEINQNSEQCERGVPCSGAQAGWTCNTNTCRCTAPEEQDEPTCGDGELNQDSEECEIGIACEEEGFICNTQTCLCEPEPSCGDGQIDPGEACDPLADPPGCVVGEVCSTSCECVPTDIPDLPATAIVVDDQADSIIFAVIGILGGLLLLKFNVYSAIAQGFRVVISRLQSGKFAYVTQSLSGKSKEEVRKKQNSKYERKMSK